MFATLHLATHNPCMIFYIMPSEKVQSRMKKTMMALLCCFLSFLNPVLLLNAYEGAKERMKTLALTMHPNVVQEMGNTKAIKNQWTTFIKIELGKSPVESILIFNYNSLQAWRCFIKLLVKYCCCSMLFQKQGQLLD